MFVNRNRIPAITSIKQSDVDASYVSKSETSNIAANISTTLKLNTDDVNNFIGLAHNRVPKEVFSRISQNVYRRCSNIDGKASYNDSSLIDDTVISHSIDNNSIASIVSNDMSDIGSYNILGSDSLSSKVSIDPILTVQSDMDEFNPHLHTIYTDIIHTSRIDSDVISVHRGGYVTTYNTSTKDSSSVDLFDVINLYCEIGVKNDTLFNKFSVGEVVTNVSYNGDDLFIIVTTNNVMTYNIKTSVYMIIDIGESLHQFAVLDIDAIGDQIYSIMTDGTSYIISRYTISTKSTFVYNVMNVEDAAQFTPNTIVIIGDEVFVYSKANRYNIDNNDISNTIDYIRFSRTDTVGEVYITSQDIDTPVTVNFITGDSSTVLIGVSTVSPSIFNNIILVLTPEDNLLTLSNNMYLSDTTCTYGQSVAYSSNVLYIANHERLSVYVTDGNGKILKSGSYNLGANRNTGKKIMCIDVNDSLALSVTFDDNTTMIYNKTSITDLVKSELVDIRSNHTSKSLNFKINDKIISMTNSSIRSIENDDIETFVYNPYTGYMTNEEFNSIISCSYELSAGNILNIVLVSRPTESSTRVTMVKIDHVTLIPIGVVSNKGWTTSVTCNSTDIRVALGRFYIPIVGTDGGFLIIADFNDNEIYYNRLTTSSSYTGPSCVNNLCSYMTIGVNSSYYKVPLSQLYYTGTGITKSHQPSTIIGSGVEVLNTSGYSRFYFDNNGDVISVDDNVKHGLFSPYVFYANNCKIVVSDKYVKVYKLTGGLVYTKSLEDYYFDEINSVSYYVNPNDVVLNLSAYVIRIHTDITSPDIDKLVNITNPLSDFIYGNGVYVVNSDNNISIVSSSNPVLNIDDVLNIIPIRYLYDKSFKTTLGKVHLFDSHIYITMVFTNTVTNTVIGGIILKVNSTTGDISFTDLNMNITSSVNNIDGNYITSTLVDDVLYVFYFSDGYIKRVAISSNMVRTVSYYRIMSNSYPISINTSVDGIVHYLNIVTYNNSLKFFFDKVVAYDNISLTATTNLQPSVSCDESIKVAVFNDIAYIVNSSAQSIVMRVGNLYSKTFYDATSTNIFKSYFKQLVLNVEKSTNDIVVAYKMNNFTGTMKLSMTSDDIVLRFSGSNFRVYAKHAETFYDKNFFDYFVGDAIVAFSNRAGGSRLISGTTYFDSFGSRLVKSTTPLISYGYNENDLITDRQYPLIREFDENNGIYKMTCVPFDTDSVSKIVSYVESNNRFISLWGNVAGNFGITGDQGSLEFRTGGDESDVVEIIRHGTLAHMIAVRSMLSRFGYHDITIINQFSMVTVSTIGNDTILPLFSFNDNVYIIGDAKDSNGIVSIQKVVDNVVGTKTIISGFLNVEDAVIYDDKIILCNDEGRIIVFNTVDSTYFEVPSIQNKIIDIGDINLIYKRIVKIDSQYLTCTVVLYNTITHNEMTVVGCKLNVTNVDGIFDVTIKINESGKIHSNYDMVINRITSPSLNYKFGGIGYDNALSSSVSLGRYVTATMVLSNINLIKKLNEADIKYTYNIRTYKDSPIPPKVFNRADKLILQFHNTIIIFPKSYDGKPNYVGGMHTIKQDIQKDLLEIVDVFVSGNQVLFTMADRSAMLVRFNPGEVYTDTGFTNYTKYNANNQSLLKYFVTDNGIVGYIDPYNIFINKDGYFMRVITNNVKLFCVDYLYNRVYFMDVENTFGYVDILTMKYNMIKSFYTDEVIGLEKVNYGGIVIFTKTKCISYYNDNFHDDVEYTGCDANLSLVTYPYVGVKVDGVDFYKM